MAARSGRRRRGSHAGAHGNDERWLLTYSDMITLLMALFIVMFSMATVNTSKFQALKTSLSDAFQPGIVKGGRSIAEGGGSAAVPRALPEPSGRSANGQEDRSLHELQRRVEAYARSKGLASKISARVERQGLVITVLTDKLLFDSGQAVLRPEGARLIAAIGGLLCRESSHRVMVEGYTDDQPIHDSTYPSNWELSTARASTVVRALVAAHVAPQRLTAAGRAYLDPVASNTTAEGRSRNRRVQIVLPRDAAPSDPAIGPQESP